MIHRPCLESPYNALQLYECLYWTRQVLLSRSPSCSDTPDASASFETRSADASALCCLALLELAPAGAQVNGRAPRALATVAELLTSGARGQASSPGWVLALRIHPPGRYVHQAEQLECSGAPRRHVHLADVTSWSGSTRPSSPTYPPGRVHTSGRQNVQRAPLAEFPPGRHHQRARSSAGALCRSASPAPQELLTRHVSTRPYKGSVQIGGNCGNCGNCSHEPASCLLWCQFPQVGISRALWE